jgi:DNA-directed RNA polymerase beta' subunit
MLIGLSFLLLFKGIFTEQKNNYLILQEKNIFINDSVLDPIVSIKTATGTTKYVYDFTVEKTRNFTLFNGLTVRDTFHKAGSSEKQPVVSKFSELLNATNKPKAPSYLVYFNQGNQSVSELRETIGHSIVEITLKKIAKNTKICIDKTPESWYDLFYTLYKKKPAYYTDCVSVDVDINILFEYKLNIFKIAEIIETEYQDCFCIFSPDCFGIIDIYFDTRSIDLPEEKLVFVTKDNSKEIYLEEVVYPILENVCLCGLSGITNMFFIKNQNEWIVETENSFLNKKTSVKQKTRDITKRFKKLLSYDCVDMTRCLSNNIWDIYHTFGIEAVRQYMIDEFSQIMEGINLSHVMLLVDKMTFLGTISSISRYTMRNEESGPFGKASFEETLDNFLKAGVYGQEEPTKGVSASIICGKKAPIGTGLCELSVDIDKLIN